MCRKRIGATTPLLLLLMWGFNDCEGTSPLASAEDSSSSSSADSSSTSISGSECGFPGVPANGSLLGSGMLFYPGEEVVYSCQEGFVIFGPKKRRCRENGTWTPGLPECKRNLALGKPSLQSSTLWSYEPGLAVDADPDSCSFTPHSEEQRWWQVYLGRAVTIQSVAVTISTGSYQHFTIFVIELLEGNKAMYKPCSKFEGKFEAKKAVFLCNDGNGHPGEFVYIHDDREGQEYFGLCEVEVFEYQNSSLCGDPEQPVATLVERKGNRLAEYSCLKGFRLEGRDVVRECNHRGQWQGEAPRCIEVPCDHPRSVKDGFIEVSNFRVKYVFGSLATYDCNPGYILWGNFFRLCFNGGSWSGSTPQCKPIRCGQPPEEMNASSTLINGSTLWQSYSKYECKPGFKMTMEKGWKSLNADTTMILSVIVTVTVLSTLVSLAIMVIVIFFTPKNHEQRVGVRASASATTAWPTATTPATNPSSSTRSPSNAVSTPPYHAGSHRIMGLESAQVREHVYETLRNGNGLLCGGKVA